MPPIVAPSTMKPHPNQQYYSAPPPHVALLRTNGHHPLLSLNDRHVSGEDIIYTIIPAWCQQMEAVMCVVVLALPHLTPLADENGNPTKQAKATGVTN